MERGPEIDLMIEHPSRPTFAIEIKSAVDVPINEVRKGFDEFLAYDEKAVSLDIYTGSQEGEVAANKFLPWRNFFEFLLRWARA